MTIHQAWADPKSVVTPLTDSHDSFIIGTVKHEVHCFDCLIFFRNNLVFGYKGYNLDPIDKRRKDLRESCYWHHKAIFRQGRNNSLMSIDLALR